jgi:hypothetical protein
MTSGSTSTSCLDGNWFRSILCIGQSPEFVKFSRLSNIDQWVGTRARHDIASPQRPWHLPVTEGSVTLQPVKRQGSTMAYAVRIPTLYLQRDRIRHEVADSGRLRGQYPSASGTLLPGIRFVDALIA